MISITTGLSREGIRRACLREIKPPELGSTFDDRLKDIELWRTGANLAKSSLLIGLFFVGPFLFYWFWNSYSTNENMSSSEVEEYQECLLLCFIAGLIELAAESMFITSQICLIYTLRSKMESLAALVRTFTSLYFAYFLRAKLTAFALGYFMGSVSMFVGYFFGLAYIGGSFDLPWFILFHGKPVFFFHSPINWSVTPSSSSLTRMAFISTIQSFWKLALSEGEKFVMILLNVVANDRGEFALASNLGSLAARLVLQPVEEAAYTIFGKLKYYKTTDIVLGNLTRAAICFGLFFLVVGTQFTHLLILILYGRKYADSTDAPYLLSWYCAYVAFMACNGITEAYVQAVCDEKQSGSFNVWLFFCSLVYLLAAVFLVPYFGTAGLIMSNCVVMSCRILLNIWFARYFKKSTAVFFPSAWTLFFFATNSVLLYLSKEYIYENANGLVRTVIHLVFGGILFVLLLVTIYLQDKPLVLFIKQKGNVEVVKNE